MILIGVRCSRLFIIKLVSASVLFFCCFNFVLAEAKTPVIIVPGYLASWNNALFIGQGTSDEWEFSLGDTTYDNLIQSFEDKGYVQGQDLFVAFYDWRQSNVDNYKTYLLPVIDQALANNPGTDKVDIIAHSMGGIFTRAYIQNPDYRDDIRNFIMIATPNYGSTDAYYLWSGGQFPPSVSSAEKLQGAAFLFYRGLTYSPPIYSRRRLVQRDIPSTQELLPTFDYLVDFDTGLTLPASGMTAQNPLLPILNKTHDRYGIMSVVDNVDQLTVIAGKGRDTIEKITVETSVPGPRWQDGKPIKGGLAYTTIGDGTVLGKSAMFPLPRINFECLGGPPPVRVGWLIKTAHACDPLHFVYGQESIPGWDTIRQEYVYDAGHRDIVTKAIPIVHQVVSAASPLDDYALPPENAEEILGFLVASPIDPVIVDPRGRRFGKNINEIGDTAKYHDWDDPLGPKMLFIDNPEQGEYTIETTGTGDGEFHIGVVKISEDLPDPVGASDEVIVPTIVGTTSLGQKEAFSIETKGQGLRVENKIYGDFPVTTVATTDQILVTQLIEILNQLESTGEVKPAVADILRRSFQSRSKQFDARDVHLARGSGLYVQIVEASIKNQFQSHLAYISFMTRLRQITPAASDTLQNRIQNIIKALNL